MRYLALRSGGVTRKASWKEITRTGGRLREALGDKTFEPLASEGGAMSQAAIVQFAREQIENARNEIPRSTSQSPAPPEGSGALTDRQLEVAQLVARGLSNKDIAKRPDRGLDSSQRRLMSVVSANSAE